MGYNKEYQRIYQLKRYHKLREEVIHKLGGRCFNCPSKEDLQIDHINPNKKTIELSRFWGISKKRFQEEISKCQLLCKKCHTNKSIIERGQTPTKGKNIHGTLSSHKYCKCIVCKKVWNNHHNKWRASKKKGV